DAELAEPVQPLAALGVEEILRAEVRHLRRDPGPEGGRIEAGDRSHHRLPLGQTLPQPLHPGADGGDGADAGDEDATGRVHSTLRAMPARVRDAMPCTNTGPITQLAATHEIRGHGGPVHSWT